MNQKIAQWRQFRVSQALQLPEAEREAFLKEQRLEKLNLSLTKQRWQQQQQQIIPRLVKTNERER
ncbi:MAG: hypothetical protein HC930_14730 [Hydrococcus sp. SU_1_0]|nr:hypothetical protein [Hydrococcus sp. SU_1_0]